MFRHNKEYLEDAILDRVSADLDAGVFNPTVKEVLKKYDFEGVLKDCYTP